MHEKGEEIHHYNVVIIGLGIAGLIAALEATKLNKTILVFSDREVPAGYIRPQRLVLTSDSIAYLQSLQDPNDPNDSDFFTKFPITRQGKSKSMQPEAKDLERFLFRKLSHHFSDKFNNDHIKIIPKHGPTSLTIHSEKIGDSDKAIIDIVSSQASIPGQRYSFDALIAADGAHHSTANQINAAFNTNIQYEENGKPSHNATVQLVYTGSEPPAFKQHPQFLVGATLSSNLADGRIKDHPKRFKFTVAGRINDDQYQTFSTNPNSPDIIQWAETIIKKKYDIETGQLSIHHHDNQPAKDHLSMTTFDISTYYRCQQNYAKLHESLFMQIGDAHSTPNYLLGTGANFAIKSARAVMSAIPVFEQHGDLDAALEALNPPTTKKIVPDTPAINPTLSFKRKQEEQMNKENSTAINDDTTNNNGMKIKG